MTHAYTAQIPLMLTMEQMIANAVHTIVVELTDKTHEARGLEPKVPDDVTIFDWSRDMQFPPTLSQRIRIGQLAAAFSLAAGRPIKYAYTPFGTVRLHAISSIERAVEAMGF